MAGVPRWTRQNRHLNLRFVPYARPSLTRRRRAPVRTMEEMTSEEKRQVELECTPPRKIKE